MIVPGTCTRAHDDKLTIPIYCSSPHLSHLLRTFGGLIREHPRRELIIVMHLYKEGTVRKFLDNEREQKAGAGLSAPLCFSIVGDAARGLAHLHSKGICHRDLKADNLLIDRKAGGVLEVVIGDFGSSKKEESEVTVTTTAGPLVTLPWAAPEVLLDEDGFKFSEPCDVYSFACVIFEVLSLQVPWEAVKAHCRF